MSTLLWIALAVFALCFIILFFFVKHGESKEEEPGTLPIIIVTAAVLALVITATFAFFMLIPMGAMFLAKKFFDFDTDINSIVFIGGMVVVYAILFDHMLHLILRKITRHHQIHHLFLYVMRFFIFAGIASFVSLSTKASIWIALVLTILFFIIDLMDQFFSKKEQPHT